MKLSEYTKIVDNYEKRLTDMTRERDCWAMAVWLLWNFWSHSDNNPCNIIAEWAMQWTVDATKEELSIESEPEETVWAIAYAIAEHELEAGR